MQLYLLIRQGPPSVLRQIVGMSLVCGIAAVTLLAIVNSVSGRGGGLSHPTGTALLFYCLAFFIFFVAERFALARASILLEGLLKDLRLRVADRLRNAELTVIERIDRGELYTTLSQEPNQISQTFQYIVAALQHVVMLAFCLIYISWISPAAFVVIVGATALLLALHRRLRRRLDAALSDVLRGDAEVVSALNDLVDGFKEVRINSRKSEGLFGSLMGLSEESRRRKVAVSAISIVVLTYGNVLLYGILGAVVFVLPMYVSGFSTVVSQMTAITLFVVGPLTYVVMLAPFVARANLCLTRLYELEARLGDPPDPSSLERIRSLGEKFAAFRHIEFNCISYTYRDENDQPSFAVGPLDLTIKRGETLFLIGGNGSGKSTLLKIVTTLYPTQTGTVRIDDARVEAEKTQGMRELYSCIFADFHLFGRLYGLPEVEGSRVNDLLKKMDLDRKVTFEDGRFSTLNLSTGQRKRLALVEALLEDKPIYVFDEWAADQDIHFRRVFYEEILKDLRARGKTVIAATHDDRFWHLADRIIRLDAGKMAEVPPMGPA